MHRHRDENRAAPFVRNRETTSQNEQWDKRRKVCVRRGEEQRAQRDTDKAAKITFDDVVKEKSKQKFFNYRRDCYCENDDHDSLLQRARTAEKLDDVLPAGTAPEKPLRNDVRPQDQWISKEQQDRSCAQDAKKADSVKPA